jgi:lipopolysaccharide transport system ATP-binding protein
MSTAVSAQGLGKRYRIGEANRRAPYGSLRESLMHSLKGGWRRAKAEPHAELWALRDLDFEVRHGEALGIVGRNGAGKSTLLKILSRITEPTTGRVRVRGRVGSLLEVGTGFHPELTGRENVYLNGAILGMSKADIDRSFDEIAAFAEIERFLDTPVKRYSSGMYMRLAFSVAAHLEPDVLVVDEVLAVGDADFQKKCLGRMEQVAGEGRTVLFVSHNLAAIQRLCQRAILLDHGRLARTGPALDVTTAYVTQQVSSGARIEWPDGEQPGDEHVRLRSIALNQMDELAPAVFASSRPIDLELEIDVLEPHPALTVGFELLTPDAQGIFWSYHTDVPDRPDGVVPTLARGPHRLTCQIPAGLLNGGTYQVRPLASLHFIRWIVNGEPVLRFSVELDHPHSPLWYAPRPGIVAPAIPWRVC